MMDGFGGMGFGWLWPAVLGVGLVVLAWGVRQLVRSSREHVRSTGASEPTGADRAHEILRERFARGEITQDELRRRLEVLDGR